MQTVIVFTYDLVRLSSMTPMPILRVDYIDFVNFTNRKLKEMNVREVSSADDEIILLKSLDVRLESDEDLVKNLALVANNIRAEYVPFAFFSFRFLRYWWLTDTASGQGRSHLVPQQRCRGVLLW